MRYRRFLLALDLIVGAGLLGALIYILVFTPIEAVMGLVQKVFYFHVAASWAGMLSFVLAGAAGGCYLAFRRPIWDYVSHSAVEIGVVFGVITIFSGMIWARPIWNTWWVWDPRLTTMAIMELVYIAYFILRRSLNTPEAQARLGAVYAIISVVTVPLTFFSIRLFRTIHPVVIASGGSDAPAFNMSTRMRVAFFISLAVFTLLWLDLLWHRVRLARCQAGLSHRRS